MRNKLLVVILLLLNTSFVFSQQFNKFGNPIVTYYSPEGFNMPEQTWCIAQDKRGVMYFGTNEMGVLEYDGRSWRKISTNSRKVLSLATDSLGVVYVGLEGDFGFLSPNNAGTLEYASLTSLLPDSLRNSLSSVYNIYCYGSQVYFCTRQYVFILKNDISVVELPRYSLMSFLCNDELLVGNYDEGLVRVVDGKVEFDNSFSPLKEKDIYAVLPVKSDEYWAISPQGFYRYNKETKQMGLIHDKARVLQKIPEEGIIPYNAKKLGNGNIGVGNVNTNWLSYFEIDHNGEVISIINKDAGLLGNQITNLYQIGDDPMWLSFYDGALAKVESASPVEKFTSLNGLEGVINGILRNNGILYIGTSEGIFYLDFDNKGFPIFRKIFKTDVWALLNFKLENGRSLLLAASLDGVHKVEGKTVTPLCNELVEIQPFAMSLCQSKINPNRLYIGTSNTIYSVDLKNSRAVNNVVQLTQPSQNVGEVKSITEDTFGNIWASSSTKSLITINTKKQLINFEKKFEKIPNISGEIYPTTHNDSLFILSSNGIYHFNYSDSSFVQGGIVGHKLDNTSVSKMMGFDGGFFFVCSNKNSDNYWIECIRDSIGTGETALKRLPKQWIGAMYSDNDVFWMGIQKELYSYNPTVSQNQKSSTSNYVFNALIRKVVFKDSLTFDGTYFTTNSNGQQSIVLAQPESQKPRLTYHYNAVVINYSATFYEEEENTVYSHYLEGSDETIWSKWDSRSEATYTNLSEGSYTFYVKAKNIYDNESTVASYSFEIRPPFYRTILAYFIYVASFVAFIWAFIKWNMRRLIAEKERLEKIVQERTAEVVAQKEEIEGQKVHIEEQNEEIKSSIQYASRIQRAILSPEEQVNTIFPDNFILYLPRDIVSGDFYVIMQVGNKKISVVADCTGHGVPGGFMSMLGMSSLNEIINKNADNLHANIILNLLREKIITSLHQTGEVGTSKDGMDLALYILDETEMTLEYAGANNPLVIIRNNEIVQVKADKMPIGIYLKGDLPFTNNVMEVYDGDVIYTFSDGYADQFGGTDQRKFMIKNLKNLFLEIHQKPMNEQREILDKTLLDWHGDSPRIDDVVVMGVRVNSNGKNIM